MILWTSKEWLQIFEHLTPLPLSPLPSSQNKPVWAFIFLVVEFLSVLSVFFALQFLLPWWEEKKQNQTLSKGKKQSKILYWQLDFNVLHIFKKSEKPFIIKFKKSMFEFWTIWIKKKHKFQRSDLNHNETNLNQTNAQHLKPFSNSWDDH